VSGGTLNWTVAPGGMPSGSVRVPGDKSISHRSVMLGSLADGITEVTGFLDGEDCLCTMKAFQAMGVRIERVTDTSLRVHGVGLHGLKGPAHDLDLGNSGTSMRLMSGLLAAQRFPTTLIGDASLSRRPMRRVIDPLARMGARIDSNDGKAPLRLHPVDGGLTAIDHVSKVASAQVKSCILLAGLYANGTTSVTEPETSRDHTERMLRAFGVEVMSSEGRAAVRGGQRLVGTSIPVPADISSAAFFLLAAAIVPGSDLLLRDVGINPTRTGVIDILRAMGASIEIENPRTFGGEPVADLRVRGQGLRGIAVDPALVASAIDEFPAIFIAAACADGETRVTGAEELRVKESDRIQTMVDGLTALGIEAIGTSDGARIRGGRIGTGQIDSHGDHRVAMSFAMAALRADGPIGILDCANVNTSFPGFARLAATIGVEVSA
jgi:3-phosphoshikimate 1-carboxyvinyltransferase